MWTRGVMVYLWNFIELKKRFSSTLVLVNKVIKYCTDLHTLCYTIIDDLLSTLE